MAQLSVNNVVMAILAVAIGLILIGSLLSPIAVDVMADLASMGEDGARWSSMVSITVIVSLLGLIIVAINNFVKR